MNFLCTILCYQSYICCKAGREQQSPGPFLHLSLGITIFNACNQPVHKYCYSSTVQFSIPCPAVQPARGNRVCVFPYPPVHSKEPRRRHLTPNSRLLLQTRPQRLRCFSVLPKRSQPQNMKIRAMFLSAWSDILVPKTDPSGTSSQVL